MKSLLIIGLTLTCTFAYGQHQLKVEFSNIENTRGLLLIELLDESEKRISEKKVAIEGNTLTVDFENLEDGSYAIRVFHDENKNYKLDTNFIGIPKEGYGFSNDAHGRFGPFPFEKWLVPVESDTSIKIRMRYL